MPCAAQTRIPISKTRRTSRNCSPSTAPPTYLSRYLRCIPKTFGSLRTNWHGYNCVTAISPGGEGRGE